MGVALIEMIPKVIGFWIITGMSFITMCVSTIFTVTLFAAIQRQTPTHLLGKIMAVIIEVSNWFTTNWASTFMESLLTAINIFLG